MRISLFITCFNDTLFPATGRAVVELLERLGCSVDFPEAQTCCGQMHGNSGYAEQGDALMRRWGATHEQSDDMLDGAEFGPGLVGVPLRNAAPTDK